MPLAENREFEVLVDGRLANLNAWNESVAVVLAGREGIELGDDHWLVITAMREYYQAFNVPPVKKLLKRELKKRTVSDRFNDDHLLELFPAGALVQGTKIAGVPVPMMDAELERDTYQAKAAPHVGHFINSFEFEGTDFKVTPLGNLLELHRWNSRLATHMAEKEGINLEKDHWEVINFLREFYFTYGVTPMVKVLMKYMAEDIGPEQASREHLYSLFPKGPSRQGSRIAGLPEPQGCIDPD
ncbi:MAG: TusE/DsrC/DsvC family sulfur relay protein [Ectothiorhodospiraceae bacterium]|nr:TusE/DsrC/DsvC family sulfur relay protein [Ectothiorhodospiraceae bacterium]